MLAEIQENLIECFEVLNLEQGSAEWLDFRKVYVGASDAPVILGISPYKTAKQLYDETMGICSPQKQTASMSYGKEKEKEIRERFNFRQYPNHQMETAVLKSTQYSWMFASFDGINFAERLFMEIKVANADDHACALAGEIPEKYKAQVAHQFLVSGFPTMVYVSHHKGQDFELYIDRRYFSDEFYAEIIKETQHFYNARITFTAPIATEYDIMRNRSAEWKRIVLQYQDAKKRKEDAEEEEKQLKNILIEMADGKKTEGGGIILDFVERKGAIEYSLVPELKDVDLEPFRKPSIKYAQIKEVK
jgi:putative phage-type endonuclease